MFTTLFLAMLTLLSGYLFRQELVRVENTETTPRNWRKRAQAWKRD